MSKIRTFLVKNKIYLQRTTSWISALNSGMILFLVLGKLQEYGVKVSITKWFLPMYIGIIIAMIYFGYLEDKFGFFKEEIKTQQKRNPYMNEIIERLDRIEKKIKLIEKK